MHTEHLILDGGSGDMEKIAHAVRLLRAGELVAFPTETVYGLGADARNPEALARLTRVKGRRDGKPYSLLVPSLKAAEEMAGGFNRIARKLARVYWPGPLTIVATRRGGGSVGLRLPEHPITRTLIAHCGFPLATPSANRSGTAEPVNGNQVREALDGEIAALLDSGPAWQGRPSTVVKVLSDSVEILREGNVPAADIIELARPTLLFVCTGNTCRSPMAAGFCMLEFNGTQRNEQLPFRVLSAGTSAEDGERADPLAMEAMREVNIDISTHRTRGLSPSLLDSADWIFTMSQSHKDSILSIVPSCADRVRLLSKRNEEIPDPVSRSLECYRQVRDKIANCLRDVVRLVGESGC
jgi:tRNA threonylcarbamoyl adenosine modification protein (Sua5/YciO/YrdC/YwlC family)